MKEARRKEARKKEAEKIGAGVKAVSDLWVWSWPRVYWDVITVMHFSVQYVVL